MGNSNHGGDSTDVNFFDAKRNDVPAYSGAHAEVYRDCPTPGGSHHNRDKVVTINETDASGRTNTIYAEAGSTVNINVGYERVGNGGRNGYIANYDERNARMMEQRQAQYYMPQQRLGYDDCPPGAYRPVHGADFRRPDYGYERPNAVGQFFGSLLGGLAQGVGFGLGERAFGRHGGYYGGRPFMPVAGAYDGWGAQNFNRGYDPGFGGQVWNNPNNYNYGRDYGYDQRYAYGPSSYNYGPSSYAYERPYYQRPGYYGHGRGNTGLAVLGGALLGAGVMSIANNRSSGYYS